MKNPLASPTGPYGPAGVKNTTGDADPEHSFYHMLMQAPAAIVVFSGAENRIEFANERYLRIAGKTRDELLHQPAFEAMPAAATQGFPELLERIRTTAQPLQLTEHKTTIERDGRMETAWLNIVCQPMKELDGSVSRVMIMVTDVTEQVTLRQQKEREEQLLRKTGDELALSIDIGHIGIWHWDAKTNVVSWSKEQLALYGLGEGEFGGRMQDFHRFVLPEDLPVVTGTATGEQVQNADLSYQFRIRRTDGEVRWMQGRSRSFYNERGELEYRTGVNMDITGEKKALEELDRKVKELTDYKYALDASSIVAITTPDGIIQYVNRNFCKISQYTPEELIGNDHRLVNSGYHPPEFIRNLWQTVGKGRIWKGEVRNRAKDGSHYWTDTTIVPFLDAGGKPQQHIVIRFDITARKQAEEKIRESEERFRSAFDNAAVGIAHVDLSGNWLLVNDRLCNIVGYSREELLASNFQKITHPDDLEADLELLNELVDGKRDHYTLEKRYIQKSGAVLWSNLTVSLVRNADGQPRYFISVLQDISRQKEAEAGLKTSEERFRTLADNIQNLAWIADGEGWITWYNRRWYDYTGTTFSEMQGWGWEKVHHPDHLNRVVAFVKEAWKKPQPFELTFPLRRHDGEYRWFLTRAFPVLNSQGAIDRWIGTNTDIDEQKTVAEHLEHLVAERTAELQAANLELQRSNEDLQQFAHVASHDLKEPIRKVLTFGSRLSEEFAGQLPDRARVYVQKMQASAERMFGLIEGVLNYSTVNSTEPQDADDVDLNDVLQHIEADLELVLQRVKGTVNREALPVVRGSAVLLNQLFYNLLNNALKFTRPGVPPVINVRARRLKASEAPVQGQKHKPAEFVQVRVCDNGIGFRQEYAERIFKTFTRLHSRDRFEGTGLGLALCKKIVERHGGAIYATGKEGEGACFYVLLPA